MYAFIVRNTYVRFGPYTFLQICGIPMGTNPGVHIADYFLFAFEYAFITRIAEHRPDLLPQFEYVRRYIDDVIAFNCPNFDEYKQLDAFTLKADDGSVLVENAGIYVSDIECRLESTATPESPSVHCLDACVNIDMRRGRLYVTLHNKLRDPKFAAVRFWRFPHTSSLIAEQTKYGLITSQFLRFARVISRKDDFVADCAAFLRVLLKERLYAYSRIRRTAIRVLRRIVPNFFMRVSSAWTAIRRKLDFYVRNPAHAPKF